MTRILFEYLGPFLLPIAIYAAWVWFRAGYVARHGGTAPNFESGPWPLLLFLGALTAFAVMAVTGVLRAGSAEGRYVPAHVEHGEVIPGRLEPKTPPSKTPPPKTSAKAP